MKKIYVNNIIDMNNDHQYVVVINDENNKKYQLEFQSDEINSIIDYFNDDNFSFVDENDNELL